MLLLAIDTSGTQGSIALARADEAASRSKIELIEVASLVGGKFSAQLVPQISELLSHRALHIGDIGLLVAVSGPGSFTGLRVGLAAVKGLAEILQKPIVAVSMLELIAAASDLSGKVLAALDAGRSDVYVGEYEILADRAQQSLKEAIVSRSEFLEYARARAAATPDPAIAQAMRTAGYSILLIPPISGEAVARLGWAKFQLGHIITPELLDANYIRRTDAEILEKGRR